jgi:hypothetical protein
MMGTWGTGAFENDTASDWVYSLEEARDSSVVASALQVAGSSSDPDVDEAVIGVAAAEVVAAALGAPADHLPSNVVAWLDAHRQAIAPALAGTARAVVARIRKRSELQELWEESDDNADWIAAMNDLDRRLAGLTG